MNIQSNLSELLLEVLSIITKGVNNPKTNSLWSMCHPLAEANYPGADDVFLTMLNSNNPSWKVIALQMLGFHYKLSSDTLNLVRALILHDQNNEVRSAAIYALANQSKNEKFFLLDCLKNDNSKMVREDSFLMILSLSGLSTKKRFDIKDQIDDGKIGITIEELKKILKENGFDDSLIA